MSDRDEKDVCWDGGAHCDRHRSLGECCHCGKKFAAPVEPPVLSRASIDELIDAYFSRQQFISQQIAGGVRHGMIALRDAILESLSQEGEVK